MFVLNFKGYGTIVSNQTNLFDKHFVACNEESGLSMPDLETVTKAYKLAYYKVDHNSQLDEVVKEIMEKKEPVICDVRIPIGLTAFPKQVSYKRNDGQMESLPLEYMNPPLSEEEMKENM